MQGYIQSFVLNQHRAKHSAEGTVLKSISRKTLLELAPALGIRTVERRLKPEILMEADEIFLSSTGGRVQPVRKIDDRNLPEVPGPVSKRLTEAFETIYQDKDPRFSHWLFYVR
jgi:branched-subunit amino acid aminotransferase/4-amino-4-deoxychorismate lyase